MKITGRVCGNLYRKQDILHEINKISVIHMLLRFKHKSRLSRSVTDEKIKLVIEKNLPIKKQFKTRYLYYSLLKIKDSWVPTSSKYSEKIGKERIVPNKSYEARILLNTQTRKRYHKEINMISPVSTVAKVPDKRVVSSLVEHLTELCSTIKSGFILGVKGKLHSEWEKTGSLSSD